MADTPIKKPRPGLEIGHDGFEVGRDPCCTIEAELRELGHTPKPILTVIVEHCRDCLPEEPVRQCRIVSCPAWPFRMGTNPWRKPPTEVQRAARRNQAHKLNGVSPEQLTPGSPDLDARQSVGEPHKAYAPEALDLASKAEAVPPPSVAVRPGCELKYGKVIGRDPRKMTQAEILALGHKPMSPLKALQQQCAFCTGKTHEVPLCVATACPAWAYRMGKNPFRQSRSEKQMASSKRQGERLRRCIQQAQKNDGPHGQDQGGAGEAPPSMSQGDAAHEDCVGHDPSDGGPCGTTPPLAD